MSQGCSRERGQAGRASKHPRTDTYHDTTASRSSAAAAGAEVRARWWGIIASVYMSWACAGTRANDASCKARRRAQIQSLDLLRSVVPDFEQLFCETGVDAPAAALFLAAFHRRFPAWRRLTGVGQTIGLMLVGEWETRLAAVLVVRVHRATSQPVGGFVLFMALSFPSKRLSVYKKSFFADAHHTRTSQTRTH